MRLILIGIASLVTSIGPAAFAQDKPNPDAAPGAGTKVEPAPPTIKLIEPGKEPRQVLRLKAKPGDTETVVMRIEMNNEMEMGGTRRAMPKNPPAAITTRVVIDSVGPEGDIHCTVTIVRAEAAALAGMYGLTYKMVVSDRGFVRSFDMLSAKPTNPTVGQWVKNVSDSFSKTSMPLPEEPVGVGAKWQSEGPLTSNGLTIDQSATYTLVSRTSGAFGVESDVKQSAKAQEIKNPMNPAGPSMSLKSLDGQIRGKTETNGVMPNKGEVAVHMTVDMLVEIGGPNKQSMKQIVNMTMTFAPAAGEGEKPKDPAKSDGAPKPAEDGKK
jgi:hypothetical protein